jgi:hypothetical protein
VVVYVGPVPAPVARSELERYTLRPKITGGVAYCVPVAGAGDDHDAAAGAHHSVVAPAGLRHFAPGSACELDELGGIAHR